MIIFNPVKEKKKSIKAFLFNLHITYITNNIGHPVQFFQWAQNQFGLKCGPEKEKKPNVGLSI